MTCIFCGLKIVRNAKNSTYGTPYHHTSEYGYNTCWYANGKSHKDFIIGDGDPVDGTGVTFLLATPREDIGVWCWKGGGPTNEWDRKCIPSAIGLDSEGMWRLLHGETEIDLQMLPLYERRKKPLT